MVANVASCGSAGAPCAVTWASHLLSSQNASLCSLSLHQPIDSVEAELRLTFLAIPNISSPSQSESSCAATRMRHSNHINHLATAPGIATSASCLAG